MNNTNVRMVRKPADDRGSARLALVIQLGVLLTLTTLFTAVMWINRPPCIETRQVLQNAPAAAAELPQPLLASMSGIWQQL